MREELLMETVKEKTSVIYVGLKLNKRTDEDILTAIGSQRDVRQRELKRIMRIGIKELHRRRAKRLGLLKSGNK